MRRGIAFVLVALATTAVLFAAAPAVVASAERVTVRTLPSARTDVEVFMVVGATDAQVGAVERRIHTSPEVRRYAHLDKQDAEAEFRRIFRKNPDLVQSIKPSDLPESFRVDVRHAGDAKAFARGMRDLPGVDSAEPREKAPTRAELLRTIRQCQGGDADVEVFMRLTATQAEIDGATAAIATAPELTVTRVLSKDDAYAEFLRIFASNRKLVNSVTAADLPVSIRVQASGPVSDEVLARVRALPGVDTVVTPGLVCDPIRKLLDRGVTPEELARLMVRYSAGLPA